MRSAPGTLLVLSFAWTSASAGADPPARTASVGVRWIGQDGQDWTGPGPSVGPDGLQDAHIQIRGLAPKIAVKAVRIEGPGTSRWEYGKNPRLFVNAELIRDTKDPSQGELYFQPDGDLDGQRLKITLGYDNDTFEVTSLMAGRCDGRLKVPMPPLPAFTERALEARWIGQDGEAPGSPGDVHISVNGLPPQPIVGAVLTDAVKGTWIYRKDDRVSILTNPDAEPLVVKPQPEGKAADLYFGPYRDESKATMTLRLIAADGQNLLVRFPGQNCDLALRAPAPDPKRVQAQPGDDLQALAETCGTLSLAPGTYRLSRPLVLRRPITVTAAGNATLVFDQAPAEPAWSSAIKIHSSNTTLNGFAIRFAGPVRWNKDISWGPAVIGMTDNTEPGYDKPKRNITFSHLNIAIPPVGIQSGWSEALRLMRLIGARSGVIANNVLRGGPVQLFAGPWRIVDNDFRGTAPGTFSHGVFTVHLPHDVTVRGNRARDLEPRGKTWRFLVLIGSGDHNVIERNSAEGLGSLDGDTLPWTNEPEIILTESYHIKYEGQIMASSPDGLLVRTGQPQSSAGRTGDVVSLLQGPAAGQWRRVVQAIDARTYLIDRPIPDGTHVVSISEGFVDTVCQENRIDIRGGRKSFGVVFVGNHFGTRVVKNHLLGGHTAFKLTACPTESPMMWGWTHAPYLGGLIEANILEDCEEAGTIGLEHDQRYIKSNRGRTYMTARVNENVVRWSDAFLRRMERGRTKPEGLIVGYPQSNDPGELVVRAKGNRLEAAMGTDVDPLRVPSLVVHAADFNSRRIVNGQYRLPQARLASPDEGREAGK